jgi:hypothetical protein
VATNGFYVDVVDAQLLAEHFRARLFIVVDKNIDQLEFQIVDHYLSTMLPKGMHFDGLDPDEEIEPSEGDWCLLSCNALYDPDGVHNHWVPLVLKTGVPDSVWIDVTAGSQSKVSFQLAEAECAEFALLTQLAELEDGSEELQIMESELASQKDYVAMFLAGSRIFSSLHFWGKRLW